MVPFKFMKDTTTGIREGKRMITITCSRAKTGEARGWTASHLGSGPGLTSTFPRVTTNATINPPNDPKTRDAQSRPMTYMEQQSRPPQTKTPLVAAHTFAIRSG